MALRDVGRARRIRKCLAGVIAGGQQGKSRGWVRGDDCLAFCRFVEFIVVKQDLIHHLLATLGTKDKRPET